VRRNKALIHRRARAQRGQGLVEFALVLPFLMMLILGAVEFGYMFNSNISLEYASREGARVAAALVNGGGPLTCPGDAQVPKVDPAIIEAVNRVLTSTGSPLVVSKVSEIRIFQATASGGEVAGKVNIWLPTPGAGPVVDGKALDFTQSSVGWSVCTRTFVQPSPDSIGVGIRYVYSLQTPFANVFGKTTLTMYDKTIMAMNPTS
jgi:hypothetical protein